MTIFADSVGLDVDVSDLPPLSQTVFMIQRSDVDREATIKLVKVFKFDERQDVMKTESRNTS